MLADVNAHVTSIRLSSWGKSDGKTLELSVEVTGRECLPGMELKSSASDYSLIHMSIHSMFLECKALC